MRVKGRCVAVRRRRVELGMAERVLGREKWLEEIPMEIV